MMKNSFVYLIRKFSNAYRFLPTFLNNCYVFLSQKEASKGPISIVWDITNKCNLRCIFCDWWKVEKNNPFPQKKELSTQEKLVIIRRIAKAKTGILSFCGGEPLLCQDLELLIKEAKSKGILVNISTNGLLLEEKAKMLVKSGIDFITLSIDSYDSEVHDRIRGHKGLFSQIEKGIKAIRSLTKTKRVYIEARCLINKMNCFSLEDFVNLWNKKVDFIIFKPIYENPFILYRVPPIMQFRPEDENKFRIYFHNFLKRYRNFDNPYNRQIPDFLLRPKLLKGKSLCLAGTFFGGINCKGDLYPCQELTLLPNRPLGNLLKEDFMDLWNCEEIRKLRECFKQGSRCNCWMDRFSLSIYLQKFLKPADRFLRYFK